MGKERSEINHAWVEVDFNGMFEVRILWDNGLRQTIPLGKHPDEVASALREAASWIDILTEKGHIKG